ncbi:hypothetical protein NC797_01415 [Aquibacillus sp. 3ASR75-11]|uniref:Uncharacterized protein n=1 Tax=Terrihalobacillus insolitus TaxID=2950438 RepID=A0A9X3WSS4_9BACI|nr:hypothetical protein [Terrihalobacillus insolitus]MDC3412141.1 hypothetical protein [Terrihalobacillus insolitus]MDC3423166.1 hypothetical protein [Terrihalobacillus insolitus]
MKYIIVWTMTLIIIAGSSVNVTDTQLLATENNEKKAVTLDIKQEQMSSHLLKDELAKNNAQALTPLTKSKNTEKPTVIEIKEQYRSSFERLEKQTRKKLNQLIDKARKEYKQKKQAGEDISYINFYTKYSALAQQLEQKTNTSFERVYTSLEQKLEENGYQKNNAIEFKNTYTKTKQDIKQKIMERSIQLLVAF